MVIERSIIGERCRIGNEVQIGVGETAKSLLNPDIYSFDLAVVAGGSSIPRKVTIGKNTVISGETMSSDYTDGKLESGGYIIKAGEAK